MLPKIIFYRSRIYDQHLARKRGYEMPSEKFIFGKIKKIEKLWDKHGPAVLRELEKITGLKWKEKDINVYCTIGVVSFSFPLTLNMRFEPVKILDILAHELVHRILAEGENWILIKKRWLALEAKYKNESYVTAVHVPVHAVYKALYLKLFGEKALQRDIDACSKNPAYARAWELVKRDGYEEIIKKLNPKYK